MQTNQAIADPLQEFKLSPEALEITSTYLSCMSISDTAETLGVDRQLIVEYLNKLEVKKFINTVYLDQGYANQFKLQKVMDDIISSKLEEAELSEVFTGKDLLDVLSLQHKMRMDHVNALTKLEEAKNRGITKQTNVQVNSYGDNFNNLLDKLVSE
jgi:hypothetical protein